MKNVLAHYLTILPTATFVAAISRTEASAANVVAVQEPLAVLKYLGKTNDVATIVKKNPDLIETIKNELVGAVNGEDELAKQDALNLLEAVAEAAVQIEAETPVKERKPRKKKDDVEADVADVADVADEADE